MALTRMSFKKQKQTLTRKQNMTLSRKQTSRLFRKQSQTLFQIKTSTLFRKQSWMLFWKLKKRRYFGCYKGCYLGSKKRCFLRCFNFVHDTSHLVSSFTTQCKKKITLKRDTNGMLILGFVVLWPQMTALWLSLHARIQSIRQGLFPFLRGRSSQWIAAFGFLWYSP